MKLLRVRDPKQTGSASKKRYQRKRPLSTNHRPVPASRDRPSQDIVPYVEGPMHSGAAGWCAESSVPRLTAEQWRSRNGESTMQSGGHVVHRLGGNLLRRRQPSQSYNLPISIQPSAGELPATSRGCYDNQPVPRHQRYSLTSVASLETPNYEESLMIGSPVSSGITPLVERQLKRTAVTRDVIKPRLNSGKPTWPRHTRPSLTIEEGQGSVERNNTLSEAEPTTSKRRRTHEQPNVTGLENFNHDQLYHVINDAVKRELLSSLDDVAAQTASCVLREIIEIHNTAQERHLVEDKLLDDVRMVGPFVPLSGAESGLETRAGKILPKILPDDKALISRRIVDLTPISELPSNWPNRTQNQSSWQSPPSGQDEQTKPLSLVIPRKSPEAGKDILPPPPPAQDAPVNLSHRSSVDGATSCPDEEQFDPHHYNISPTTAASSDHSRELHVTAGDVSGFVSVDFESKDLYFRHQLAPRRSDSSLHGNLTSPEAEGIEAMNQDLIMCDTQQSTTVQEALTPVHLKKAKLMFFYTRYPTTNVLKYFFSDVKFTRATTSQLIKWFSNFREFYYIQVEKFARQALTDGITEANQLQVSRDGELFRVLNLHYNKNEDFEVPPEFDAAVDRSLKEFFAAIRDGKDRHPSWKKSIYKVIGKFDQPVPDTFKSPKFPNIS